MPIAHAIQNSLSSSSMIRRLFEEGAALKKIHGADKVFDFSIGNPDIEPPAAFHEAFLAMAQDDAAGKTPGSHGYMPNAGFPDVREKIAAKAAREHKVALDSSHIVMSVGAAGGLNTVFKTILNAGDEVIVPVPYFMEYRAYVTNYDGVLVEVPTTENFDLDVEEIRARLSAKTAAIIINSPHNPTGRVYSADTLARLSAALAEHGRLCGRMPYLVADEPYREIAYGVEVPPVLNAYSESIVVSSYSKSLSLPGERIGYIAVSPTIADKDAVVNGLIYATRVLGFVNAPALMQRIVARLTDARVDVGVYERRRDTFKRVLDEVGLSYAEPQGAFYLFVKTPPQMSDDITFSDHLKKHLILGVPGSGFGKKDWIRFAYCVDERIIKASSEAFKKAMAFD